jgi:putative SOS response-associated peptidase YedK
MRWGLVPFWAKDIKNGYSAFNAKSEGIEGKPAFREPFKRRRCLIPFNSFYEWKSLGRKEKQPFAIALKDESLMAMAGLWDTWRSTAGETVRSFTIITCSRNELVGQLHNRMPVILHREDWPAWLGEETGDSEQLKSLLVPYAADEMTMWPVDLFKPVTMRGFFPGHPEFASKLAPAVAQAAKMTASGRPHIPVAGTYPLSSIKEATAHAQRGGKILLDVAGSST